jgi:hypothetical protein
MSPVKYELGFYIPEKIRYIPVGAIPVEARKRISTLCKAYIIALNEIKRKTSRKE